MIPYENRIVIKAMDPEQVSSGGIIIPDAGKEKALPGTVIAVGPGAYSATGQLIPMVTKVGDTVMYPKFGCHSFETDGEEYLIIRESDLMVNLGKR